MAVKFIGIPAFLNFLTSAQGPSSIADELLKKMAKEAGDKIIEEIHRVIGTYEYGWTPLAASTLARKQHGDTPLEETGKLKASYTYRIFKVRSGYRVRIGSSMPDIARAHEFGTAHVPPRPLMQPATEHTGQKVHAQLGPMTVAAFTGKSITVRLT